jgi:AraC family transcriptional activator of pyochelin receptor
VIGSADIFGGRGSGHAGSARFAGGSVIHKRLELDLREVQDVLRNADFIHSRDPFGPTSEYFLAREHGYRRIDDNIFLHVLDFTVGRPYSLRMARPDVVCIQLIIKGAYNRRWGDRVDLVGSTLVEISNFPFSIAETEAGTKLRGALIMCNRQYLLDQFGLNVDRIPESYKRLFLSKLGMPDVLSLLPTPAMIYNVDQIISCKYNEPLRGIYIRAKTMEIVCDVVSQINVLGIRKPFRLRSQNKAQAIEAAAAIYRRELSNPPTIAQLASRVGLNRNELTTGFRDMFGATPHAYATTVRMDEAHNLLLDGRMSISEIARRVGYEGYSSFSRAYQAHFGRSV